MLRGEGENRIKNCSRVLGHCWCGRFGGASLRLMTRARLWFGRQALRPRERLWLAAILCLARLHLMFTGGVLGRGAAHSRHRQLHPGLGIDEEIAGNHNPFAGDFSGGGKVGMAGGGIQIRTGE
jgi:hypothetical protein